MRRRARQTTSVGRSRGAARARRAAPPAAEAPDALPDRISPMLAQAGPPFDSPDHLFEIKWDGTRCIAFVRAGGLGLQNRRFIEMRDRYPELACLLGLPVGTVLDSEIIVLKDGRPSFECLQQREHLLDPRRIGILVKRLPATMMAFDLLYDRGRCIMALPLSERRARLAELVRKLGSPHVIATDAVVEHGQRFFAEIERHALEGMMAKRLSSAYLPGRRSPHWIKVKVARTGEFDIIGYTQREGEPVVSALALGEPHGRGWHFKGKVGSGFTEPQRGELFRALSNCPPLPHPPKNVAEPIAWRATGLRCRVRFFEKTPTGMLRAPVFKGLTS